MTTNDAQASGVGASSPDARMWEQADWPQIETEVKRLHMRIAKTVREGRWGKATAWQRLLTRSHSGKMLAVKRVTENRGKRTPGVDGKVWLTSASRGVPIIGLIFSTVALDEKLSTQLLAATALIVGGVALGMWPRQDRLP